MTEPASVYRLFDLAGGLLYVGCTGLGAIRFAQHRTTQPWWSEVATITVQHFDNHRAALAAEKQAQQTESPRYQLTLDEISHKRVATRRLIDERRAARAVRAVAS